jgi:hypothetical protein
VSTLLSTPLPSIKRADRDATRKALSKPAAFALLTKGLALNERSPAARQLPEATERLESLLVSALDARHEAISDWAAIKFALRDAARYRWLTEHAFIGECFTEDGTILDIQNTDRRVPDSVGKRATVSAAIDAAIDDEIGRTQEATITGDGTGVALPPVRDSAYSRDAKPLPYDRVQESAHG